MKIKDIEFNVDSQLSDIAEEITKHGINFCCAEFDHVPTGETFVITVSRMKWTRNQDRLVGAIDELLDLLSTFVPESDRKCIEVHNVICDAKKLLGELGHEI